MRMPLFESWRSGEGRSRQDLPRVLPRPRERRRWRIDPSHEHLRRVRRALPNRRPCAAIRVERRRDFEFVLAVVDEVVLGGEGEAEAVGDAVMVVVGGGTDERRRLVSIKLPVRFGSRALHRRWRPDVEPVKLVVRERVRLVERLGGGVERIARSVLVVRVGMKRSSRRTEGRAGAGEGRKGVAVRRGVVGGLTRRDGVVAGRRVGAGEGRSATAVCTTVRVLPDESLRLAVLDEQVAAEDLAVADELGEAVLEKRQYRVKKRRAQNSTHLIRACRTRFSIGGMAVSTLSLVADLNGVRIARCFARRRSTCKPSRIRLISASSSLILTCTSGGVRELSKWEGRGVTHPKEIGTSSDGRRGRERCLARQRRSDPLRRLHRRRSLNDGALTVAQPVRACGQCILKALRQRVVDVVRLR